MTTTEGLSGQSNVLFQIMICVPFKNSSCLFTLPTCLDTILNTLHVIMYVS